MFNIYGEYFFGNKISDYGLKNGYVDYRTLAKAFDAVLNNDIVQNTSACGFDWELVSGWKDYSEEKEAARDRIEEIESDMEELRDDAANYRDQAADAYDAGNMDLCDEMEKSAERCADRLEELRGELEELEEHIADLEAQEDETPEIFQWYIVSDSGAEILQDAEEIVYRCNALDLNVWGVTHWGTSWDYVLTDIPCNTGKF